MGAPNGAPFPIPRGSSFAFLFFRRNDVQKARQVYIMSIFSKLFGMIGRNASTAGARAARGPRPPIIKGSEAFWDTFIPSYGGANFVFDDLGVLKSQISEHMSGALLMNPKRRIAVQKGINRLYSDIDKAQRSGWKSAVLVPEHKKTGYNVIKHELTHAYDVQIGRSPTLPAADIEKFAAAVGPLNPVYRVQFAAQPITKARELLAFAHTHQELRSAAFPTRSAELNALLNRTRQANPLSALRNEALNTIRGLPEGGAGAASRHNTNAAATGLGPDGGAGSKWRGLKVLGERLMRSAGIRTADSIVEGVERAFPGIFEMSRSEFVGALKSGRYGTKFAEADRMTGRKELGWMEQWVKEAGAWKEGNVVAHLPADYLNYERKIAGFVKEGELVAGGYISKKGANYPWERSGLYSLPGALPRAAGDKFSVAKVLSAQLMKAGGFAPASLSTPGAKSYWDVAHSIRANMQHGTLNVKANTTGMTVPGLAQHPRRGGSRQAPQGGT